MSSRMLKGISAVALCASLVGCGKQIPDGWSEEVYDIACDALDVVERYNDGDITADGAETTMNQLLNKLDSATMEDETQLTIIHYTLQGFIWELNSDAISSTTMDTEDDLRAMINKKY